MQALQKNIYIYIYLLDLLCSALLAQIQQLPQIPETLSGDLSQESWRGKVDI